jgi:transposase
MATSLYTLTGPEFPPRPRTLPEQDVDARIKSGHDGGDGGAQTDPLPTDAEWVILGPFLPAEAKCGRKRAYPMREVVNAICYVLRGGIAWRLMPDSFPPWRTAHRWFARLRDDGTWETINHHLVMRDRERTGREASPTAAVMDSQSVKTTGSGGVRGGACPRAGEAGAVGWRQEDQGTQAARADRHRRPGAQAAGPRGRHPGPRRRRPAAAGLAPELAVRATRLRR